MSRIPWVILESISRGTYCSSGYGVRCVLNEWWTLQSVVSHSQGLTITHFGKVKGKRRWVEEAEIQNLSCREIIKDLK